MYFSLCIFLYIYPFPKLLRYKNRYSIDFKREMCNNTLKKRYEMAIFREKVTLARHNVTR